MAYEDEGEDEDREDHITARLVISDVNAQDSGVYHCLAENQIGSNFSNGVILDIYCKYVYVFCNSCYTRNKDTGKINLKA